MNSFRRSSRFFFFGNLCTEILLALVDVHPAATQNLPVLFFSFGMAKILVYHGNTNVTSHPEIRNFRQRSDV